MGLFARLTRRPALATKRSCAAELAALGHEQRRLIEGYRKRRVLEALRNSGAQSLIAPREVVVAGIRDARRNAALHPAARAAQPERK